MTILQQFGGKRSLLMIGGRALILSGGKGLGIKWPGKPRKTKGNYVAITLQPNDTYDMEFFNVSQKAKKSVKKYTNVYADMLMDIFEKWTGTYLTFGKRK